MYGFLALFLGFCQMHVPVLMILDKHFEQNDADYDAKRDKTRKSMVIASFVVCLLFGTVPLLGWTPMTFEPSGLSCSVYDANASVRYISYIVSCFFVFELIPLIIVAYCKIKAMRQSQSQHQQQHQNQNILNFSSNKVNNNNNSED